MLPLTPAINAGHHCYLSLPSHQLATNAPSNSPTPLFGQPCWSCWPPMLTLTPLPSASRAGHQCHRQLPSHWLSLLKRQTAIKNSLAGRTREPERDYEGHKSLYPPWAVSVVIRRVLYVHRRSEQFSLRGALIGDHTAGHTHAYVRRWLTLYGKCTSTCSVAGYFMQDRGVGKCFALGGPQLYFSQQLQSSKITIYIYRIITYLVQIK